MHALVTGASGGIGLELARLLAADGHRLTLVARSRDRLEQLAAELGGAEVVALDLAEPGAPGRVVAAAPEVDVLVNNAGYGDFGPFERSDLGRQLGMVDLNVRALTELTHRHLPGMLARRQGRVLNVASTAAFAPGPLMAVYYATKAYVLSFSEALAEETRGTGVTVTALCPGPTASGFQAAAAMGTSRLVAGRRLPSAADVAREGYAAMLAGRPVAVTGGLNRAMAGAVRFAPRPLVRRAVHRAQEARGA
ncbi:SDR family NAD(P)-dependent oxidoreductase [Geodermatophilus sp. SYSU D00758]